MKKTIIYITIALVALILLLGAYQIFFGTNTMNYSIILDKKEISGGEEITVYHGGEEKTLFLPNSLKLEPAPAYHIKAKKKKIISISPVKYSSGKIMSIKGNEVSLKDNVIKTTENTKYYKLDGKSITEISDKSFVVGYQGYRFILDKNNNVKIVLCSIPELNRIRTLISSSDFTKTHHSEIRFLFDSETELKSKDLSYKFAPGDQLTASINGKSISLSLTRGSSTTHIADVSSRIEIIQGNSTKIKIPSNTRKNGYIPSYYGSFELTLEKDGIKLINESYINDYLKGVVPSEMPSSGGLEGYKVQSVVSRTTAYYNLLSNKYAEIGVHVMDSKPSQMYEASLGSSQSDDAVESTSGEILTQNGEIIDAMYYSTSPGFGASYEDVFGKVIPEKTYLNNLSFDETGKKLNVTNEEDITLYLKDWTAKSYDSNSPFFRWKYSIDYSELSKIVNSNIYSLYTNNPKEFKKKSSLFIYKSTNIPKEGIGRVRDIKISDRNSSGIVTEIMIETESDTYKITGADTLRKLLIPKKEFELTTIYGKPVKGLTSLPSSFFTIEKNMAGDKFKSITIYGGGDGHGVGLSQHGAIGLSRKGKSYKEVVKTFYPGGEIVNIEKEFRLEVENRKL